MKNDAASQPTRLEEVFTILIGLLTMAAAGAGVFIPGFYDGIVDPTYATGTITADVVSLLSIPLLGLCIWLARRGSLVARMAWIALVVYLGYAYANYAFDRLYTVFFLAYVAIFGLSCMVILLLLARLDVGQLAEATRAMPLRRVTSGFLVFTGWCCTPSNCPLFWDASPAIRSPAGLLSWCWIWPWSPRSPS
jgi:hypothetical protein